jgi:hypothetical protein
MIQDKQNPYPAGFTVGMSITLMDRISGPFQVSFAFYLPNPTMKSTVTARKFEFGAYSSSTVELEIAKKTVLRIRIRGPMLIDPWILIRDKFFSGSRVPIPYFLRA